MSTDRESSTTKNDLQERRNGLLDRRIKNKNKENPDRRAGPPDRRIETVDRDINVITGSGEYKGTINLYSAPVGVDRVSDFFIKSDISFLTLYKTVLIGQPGKVIFINMNDIALVIPLDDIFPRRHELRKDIDVTVKLKSGLGQIKGKINLLSESRQVDRISDLLNYPGKRWLVVYLASFRGKAINAAVINMNFISGIED